jgi:hypothetical protein
MRALLCAAALLVGCRAPSGGGEVADVSVERADDRVTVTATRDAETVLTADFTLTTEGVILAYDDGVRLDMRATLPRPRPYRATGEASSGPQRLTVESGLSDAMVTWTATLDSQRYELLGDTRRDCADALSPTPLGGALGRLLQLHDAVTGKMAETRGLFELALLSTPDDVYPSQATDTEPPIGILPGDTPALGMTCSEDIQCPASAPFCVTANHDERFGSCTRSCVLDDDCLSTRGRGHCGSLVGDIPGVHPIRMCELSCGADLACPGLLQCQRSLAPCVPSQAHSAP